MKSLFVTVAGIVLGLVASLASIAWLAILSTVIALIGSYAQYKDALPYEFVFNGGLWQEGERDFKLAISKKEHKKVNPTATVYMLQNQGYQLIACDISADAGDAIILGAVIPFDGKVVIK
jgi:hypothetical protein